MMLSSADLTAILPLILLAGMPVVLMFAIAIRRNHLAAVVITLLGLAAAFGSLWIAAPLTPRRVTPLLTMDSYALFYIGLVIAASFAVVILSYGYFEKHEGNPEELYILLLVSTLGSAVLASSSHLVSFFLGLETLSVPLYAMIGYLHMRRRPLEAGLKYLILAGASSAFLLFGMALIYAELGTMEFVQIAAMLAHRPGLNYPLLATGMALIVTGVGFKLALVPFHMWTPDVYEGAPAPVTAFVATVSKGGVVAILLRYFNVSGGHAMGPVFVVFSILAIASMFAGNLLALLQDNVKRILAYSSIAHLGYIVVAFQAGGPLGAAAATFYITAYFVMILGAFGVVTVLSSRERDADALADYRGLFWRRPLLGGIFTAMLLSLAGIPITAGFLGKFYIVTAGAAASIWALLIILVVTSAIGLFYYLRILVVLYTREPEGEAPPRIFPSLSPASTLVLGVLTLLLLWLGVYPGPMVEMIRTAIASLL